VLHSPTVDQLSRLTFVVGFLHHFKHLPAWCLKLGHDRFLLSHFQFIIHQSYHSTPYIGKSGSQLTLE
jgi:hypothetical protein